MLFLVHSNLWDVRKSSCSGWQEEPHAEQGDGSADKDRVRGRSMHHVHVGAQLGEGDSQGKARDSASQAGVSLL